MEQRFPFLYKKRPEDAAHTAADITPLAEYGLILVFSQVYSRKSQGWYASFQVVQQPQN